jgi:hypothetical protein
MSNPPNSATVDATACSTSSDFDTSASIAMARPPPEVISDATDATRSPGIPTMVTEPPSAAIILAVAAPIPLPAPVINAVLPSNLLLQKSPGCWLANDDW